MLFPKFVSMGLSRYRALSLVSTLNIRMLVEPSTVDSTLSPAKTVIKEAPGLFRRDNEQATPEQKKDHGSTMHL